MRALIQRISKASVITNTGHTSSVNKGLLVFLGIEAGDTDEDIGWLCGKISRLRIFDDQDGIMNLSVVDIGGEILVISQFTLHASTKKGNRPSYFRAASPEEAIPLYENFLNQIEKDTGKTPGSGKFGEHMNVSLINDGPVTILIDTKNKE